MIITDDMQYIVWFILVVSGFPMAWALVLLNQKWEFLPRQGFFSDFFNISKFCGGSIWAAIVLFAILIFSK